MANNDMFAPPSKEELEKTAMFAPPSKEELGLLKNPEDISKLESLARGMAQGATFNSADELTGAIESASKGLTGEDKVESLKDLIENYKKHRDESRANYKAAQEANPLSYGAGELGGGLALMGASGGLGLASKASEASQTAKLLANSPRLANILNSIKTGALYGAASGYGGSEAKDTSGDIENTLSGAEMGAGTGLVLGGAGAALGKAADVMSNSKFGKKVSTLAEAIKNGEATSPKDLQAESIANSDMLYNTLKDTKDSVGKEYNTLLNKIDSENIENTPITKINDILSKIKDRTDEVGNNSTQGQEMIDLANEIKQGIGQSYKTLEGQYGLKNENLNAKDTHELYKLLGDTQYDKDTSKSTSDFIANLKGDLVNNLEQASPGAKESLENINDKYESILNAYKELGIKAPSKMSDVASERIAKENLRNTILHNPNDIGGTELERLNAAFGPEGQLAKINPDKANELMNTISNFNKRADLAEATDKMGFTKGMISKQSMALQGVKAGLEGYQGLKNLGSATISDIGSHPIGQAMKNIATGVVNTTGSIGEIGTKTGQNLYSMAPESIQELASKVGGSVGKTLQNIANQPDKTRNAMLFTALQRPEFREALATHQNSNGENDGK